MKNLNICSVQAFLVLEEPWDSENWENQENPRKEIEAFENRLKLIYEKDLPFEFEEYHTLANFIKQRIYSDTSNKDNVFEFIVFKDIFYGLGIPEFVACNIRIGESISPDALMNREDLKPTAEQLLIELKHLFRSSSIVFKVMDKVWGDGEITIILNPIIVTDGMFHYGY